MKVLIDRSTDRRNNLDIMRVGTFCTYGRLFGILGKGLWGGFVLLGETSGSVGCRLPCRFASNQTGNSIRLPRILWINSFLSVSIYAGRDGRGNGC